MGNGYQVRMQEPFNYHFTDSFKQYNNQPGRIARFEVERLMHELKTLVAATDF